MLGAEKYTDRGGGRRAQNWNKNGNTGQVQDLYVDEVVKKRIFERVTFYGKKGKKLFAVSKQYAGYESFYRCILTM